MAGLNDALAARGHDVRVVLPQYAHLAGTVGARAFAVDGDRYRLFELERTGEQPGPRGSKRRVLLLDLGELAAESIYTGDARDGVRFLRLAAACQSTVVSLSWVPVDTTAFSLWCCGRCGLSGEPSNAN